MSSESNLISVEQKGRTMTTNCKTLSGIFFRFCCYHWSIFFRILETIVHLILEKKKKLSPKYTMYEIPEWEKVLGKP